MTSYRNATDSPTYAFTVDDGHIEEAKRILEPHGTLRAQRGHDGNGTYGAVIRGILTLRESVSERVPVVIKVVPWNKGPMGVAARHEHEAMVRAGHILGGRGVPRSFGCGEYNGDGVLVMEEVPGKPLSDVKIPDLYRLAIMQTICLLVQLLVGGLVHGDPTSANIIVDSSQPMPTVYLIDFGFAMGYSAWNDKFGVSMQRPEFKAAPYWHLLYRLRSLGPAPAPNWRTKPYHHLDYQGRHSGAGDVAWIHERLFEALAIIVYQARALDHVLPLLHREQEGSWIEGLLRSLVPRHLRTFHGTIAVDRHRIFTPRSPYYLFIRKPRQDFIELIDLLYTEYVSPQTES